MCIGKIAGGVRPAMERMIQLEPTPYAAREARRFVSQHFHELGFSTLADDGELIVSELVTNSLEHASKAPLSLGIRLAGSLLILEDWDCSPDPPIPQEPDYMAESGRGLHVVKELSITWGCETFLCGKVVWVLLG